MDHCTESDRPALRLAVLVFMATMGISSADDEPAVTPGAARTTAAHRFAMAEQRHAGEWQALDSRLTGIDAPWPAGLGAVLGAGLLLAGWRLLRRHRP